MEAGTRGVNAPNVPTNDSRFTKLPRHRLPSGCTVPNATAWVRYAEAYNAVVVAQIRKREVLPPPGGFGSLHPAHARLEALLAEHAPRPKVLREIDRLTLSRMIDAPHLFVGERQFLAVPPTCPPSKRALILLKYWPKGIYAQLPDDVRVLACFDEHDRLAAYEIF
jgi:hypothetical protein